jgi:TP901 family phage tail tape measure protein
MSEFIADARVLIRPDTTGFRAQLQEQVNRAIAQAQILPLNIPIVLGGAQLAGVTAATAALAAEQKAAEVSTLGLTKAGQLENTTFGRQAVILQAASTATAEKAGIDTAAAAAARSHAVAQGQVGKAAVASTAGMLGLRGAVLTAGTAFIAATVGFQALGKAIGSSIEFERQLNVFAVTAGATADELERVSETARQLGRDITLPGVSASDAAETLSLLSRAGLDVNESLGAVRGTLQLATAAQIENAEATTLVANALNAFKLQGSEATRVADLFAGAANESQGNISDMGIALRQASAAAAGLGLSVEDTITLLTQLSRAGLTASDAGTSLRTGLLRLIQNLPKVNEEVAKLGINFRDAAGNIRPEFFEEVGAALRKLTPAARQAAQANLGGADALRLYLLLGREAAGTFDAVGESIGKQGLAAELAAAQTEGLGGDVEAAKNQFADLGLTVGNLASGPLSLFIRTASAAAGAVNDVVVELESADQGLGETFGNFINRFSESFARLNFQFRQGVRGAHEQGSAFDVLASAARSTTTAIDALATALENAGKEAISQQGLPAEGLNVQQVLNRVAGFDAEEVRARISGSTSALVGTLEEQQQFLIQQLNRQFVKNRPALRRALENALLGAGGDLEQISREGAADAKRAADDAARAIQEADQALISALSQRRDDAQRRITAAADTEGVRDDIQRQNEFQALIKQQIAKVGVRIKDEQARKEVVRQLRIALIASRAEEEKLRQEQREDAAARRAEGIDLDIAFAETTGNVNREIAARQRLIALLRKQQAAVKKGTVEWKRLRNEIAAQKAAIKDARGEAEDEKEGGKTAQQFFFEQLQAQQGFASNLLGNLITGPTAGLVGQPSPTTVPSTRQVAQEAKAAGPAGPTSGQANTTNGLLERILNQLQRLNGTQDHPEATRQRAVGAPGMDGAGNISGI